MYWHNDLIRTYSVWHYNANTLEVDIAVCTFSNAQGAKWAIEINVGDTVYFRGPKGKFIFDNSA
jgi:NADPH-dependent ferric siderophore reductase